jgi:hypothetical protein
MNFSSIYILISIAVLAIVALLIFFVRKQRAQKKLTPLAGLAFAFVVASLMFSEQRLIGYSLMGVGVILALVEIITTKRKS